jgi:hypothetical protein
MAEQEMANVSDQTAVHARDYSRFTTMLKWSAVACFLIAMVVLLIIS